MDDSDKLRLTFQVLVDKPVAPDAYSAKTSKVMVLGQEFVYDDLPLAEEIVDKKGRRFNKYPNYRSVVALLLTPSGAVYSGVSVCSPEDQFVRSSGREVAKGRARQKAFRAIASKTEKEDAIVDIENLNKKEVLNKLRAIAEQARLRMLNDVYENKNNLAFGNPARPLHPRNPARSR